jgi:serine/threonine protein phosphatase PrpC
MSSLIYDNLENMGIECDNVIVVGERKKIIYIFGIKMVNYAGSIQDITDMFERVCGTRFGDPEYILRGNYVIMKNQSRNKFKIYSVQASKSADEIKASESFDLVEWDKGHKENRNEINGDSISVFDGRDGFSYGLISDGMGSGKNAALSSRLTALVMEKLLGAGNQKDLTLEMLNSLLLSKSDECFASVDLFEADLITGKASFIKAGAAPSFIIRDGRMFKVQSSTVPAGIISGMNSEQTKFELEDGDYIMMISDGVISTFEEGSWLFEMLSSDRNLSDPKNLLNNILSGAAQTNQRKDDMSVLFMRVAEEKNA